MPFDSPLLHLNTRGFVASERKAGGANLHDHRIPSPRGESDYTNRLASHET